MMLEAISDGLIDVFFIFLVIVIFGSILRDMFGSGSKVKEKYQS